MSGLSGIEALFNYSTPPLSPVLGKRPHNQTCLSYLFENKTLAKPPFPIPVNKRSSCPPQELKKEINAVGEFQIGEFITEMEYEEIKDEEDLSEEFEKGECAVFQTRDNRYQFVLVTKQVNAKVFFMEKDGKISEASVLNLSKIMTQNFNKEPLISKEEIAFDTQLTSMSDLPLQSSCYAASLPVFNNASGTLEIAGKRYAPIDCATQNFSTQPLALCGSSPDSEIILFDPGSTCLARHFDILMKKMSFVEKEMSSVMTNYQIFKMILAYVREHILIQYKPKVMKLVNDIHGVDVFANDNSVFTRAVPLDPILRTCTGSSRHHAIVVSYFLDRLTKTPNDNPVLQGVIQIHRFNRNAFNGHYVVTCVLKSPTCVQAWFLDSKTNEIYDISIKEEAAKIKKYGDDFVKRLFGQIAQPLPKGLFPKPLKPTPQKPPQPILPDSPTIALPDFISISNSD